MFSQVSRTTRWLIAGGMIGAAGACLAALILIPSTLGSMLSASSFLPHATCYLYNQQLITLHLSSDAAIWLAYVSISLTLVYLVWRTRREIPFSWMFLAFGLFIVACGFTHFMEMVVLYKPLYWLAGDVKLVTALASVVTAMALPGLVPQVHGMVAAAHVSEQRRRQLERANGELQQISSRILIAQDSERSRIARELHDGVGQYLAAIKMSCDVALQRYRSDDGRAALEDALRVLDRCTSEVRTMSHLLHPPLLDEIGLASAVPWYAEEFAGRSGIEVSLELPEQLDRLPEPVELALFRVLQEGLTNIHRHSGSKKATIRLRADEQNVALTIEDFGTGFGPGSQDQVRSGVGIASMRERVRELGGELQIDSTEGGTTLRVVLPLQNAATKEEECPNASSS